MKQFSGHGPLRFDAELLKPNQFSASSLTTSSAPDLGSWKRERAAIGALIIQSAWEQVRVMRDAGAKAEGIESHEFFPDSLNHGAIREYFKSGVMHPSHSMRLIGKAIEDFVAPHIRDSVARLPERILVRYSELVHEHPLPRIFQDPTELVLHGLKTGLTALREILIVCPPCFEKAIEVTSGNPRMPTYQEMKILGASALNLSERLATLHGDHAGKLFGSLTNSAQVEAGEAVGVQMERRQELLKPENFVVKFESTGPKLCLAINIDLAPVNFHISPRTGCPAQFRDSRKDAQEGPSALQDMRAWVETLAFEYYRRVEAWGTRSWNSSASVFTHTPN